MPSPTLAVGEIDSNVRPKLSEHGRPHTHTALIFSNKLPVAITVKYNNITIDGRMHTRIQ